jgi:hypothetical protein
MPRISNDTIRNKRSFFNSSILIVLILLTIQSGGVKAIPVVDVLSYLVETVSCFACKPIAGII